MIHASVCLAQPEGWQANPDIVEKLSSRKASGDGLVFNYVESEVPDYELPDALTKLDGSQVDSATDWPARRAELLELFREHVYGHRPSTPYTVEYNVLEEREDWFDGTAIGRTVSANIHIDDRAYAFKFVVLIPRRPDPVPAFVHINNRYFMPLEETNAEDPFWPAKTILRNGYATASFHTSDVDPDNKSGYAEGVRSFFADGKPPTDNAWRSLSAWGWAASLVLDYLETCPEIDAKRAAVSGHSRGGKTALWAACEDPRFQIAYSNNSGCGGAALSRRAYGETVARITSSFPHWFCKNFSDYSNKEAELPVDQHEVFALLAPRAAYVTSADEDLWADPRGEYASLIAAAPVFQLLGKQSIVTPAMPELNKPRIVGQTGYHIRTGGHGLEQQDWDWFIRFADTILK